MPDCGEEPTYDLAEFQRLVEAGLFRIEPIAANGAGGLELDEADIVECMLLLDEGDFYKTMPARLRPGLFHDVYRPTYERRPIYSKIQIMFTKQGARAAIISFKKDLSR